MFTSVPCGVDPGAGPDKTLRVRHTLHGAGKGLE